MKGNKKENEEDIINPYLEIIVDGLTSHDLGFGIVEWRELEFRICEMVHGFNLIELVGVEIKFVV